MSVTPSPIAGFAGQFFDNNGVILSGGKIYTYAAGTTTPQATYTSATGVTPHANPIVLDSAGRVPGGEIWLTDSLIYKFVIETSTNILIGTYDNITGVNSNFVNYTVQEEVITATAGQTVFNLTTINYTPGTNSLSVYIDGVNQYVGDSYLETDSDTVTFTAGLHVGAEVKFSTAVQVTTNTIDAANVSYDPPFTGSVPTNVEDKLAQTVSVKDFGAVGDGVADDTAAIQAAIDSGASKVTLGCNSLVTSVLTLASDQEFDFAGGSLIVDAAFSTTTGVLAASAKNNIIIRNPIIDASATAGVTGIKLTNSPDTSIFGGRITKANIELYGPDNTTPMNYTVSDVIVNGSGWQNPIVYVGEVYKASFNNVTAFDGLEGFGVYNAARHIKYVNCESYGHTRDGFVIIEGQKIAHVNCMSYENGQSGFTTQRLTAGTDVQRVSYSGCHAYDNAFDGFDIRGSAGVPFGVNMLVSCDGCIATGNTGAGFYVVKAEGTTLSGCVTAQNLFPGISVDQCENVLLTGCSSFSNANSVPVSTAKAGILFQSCANSGAVGCISNNSIGATQHYGISFTGATKNNWISGGNYLNNVTMPAQLGDTGTEVYVTGAAIQDIANVFPDSVSGNTGIFSETGLGVPTHTRPKSSTFRRLDAGGNGEVYVSNGGGSWYLLS